MAAACDPDRERRTDFYLARPAEHLAVKLRDGRRLEVKRRDDVSRAVALGDGVDGAVERWRRWSFVTGSIHVVGSGSPDGWIAVAKSRSLVDVRPESTSPDGTEAGSPDYELEISEVSGTGAPWWTLAIEIPAGEPARDVDVLREVVASVGLDRLGGGRLVNEHSCSYARWAPLR